MLDASSGAYVPRYGAINSARLPAFTQLDVRVDRTWTYPDLEAGCSTSTSRTSPTARNVEGYSYSYDYSQKSPVTGLPILPILGVEAQW